MRLLSLDLVKRWGIKLAAFKQSEGEITKGFCKTKAQCDILNRWVIFAWHPQNLKTVREKDKPNNQSRLRSIYPVSMSTTVWILYFIHLLSIVGFLFFFFLQSSPSEKNKGAPAADHTVCALFNQYRSPVSSWFPPQYLPLSERLKIFRSNVQDC